MNPLHCNVTLVYINLIRMLSVSYIHEPIALQRNIGVIGDEIEKRIIIIIIYFQQERSKPVAVDSLSCYSSIAKCNFFQ